MSSHLEPTKLKFITEIKEITNSRIQPLLLMKVNRQENFTLDNINKMFLTLFFPLSKTDCENDEEWASKPAIDCVKLQLTKEIKCIK